MIFSRNALETELAAASLSTSERSSIDALKHILIAGTSEEGVAVVAATDIDTAYFGRVAYEGQPTAIFAPAKRILGIVRSMSDEKVTLSSSPAHRIKVKGLKYEAILPGMNPGQFPQADPEPPESSVTLAADHLFALLRDGGFCLDPEKDPAAVKVDFEAGRVTVSSSDRAHVAIASGLSEDSDPDQAPVSALLGGWAADKVRSLVSRSKKVTLNLGKTKISVADQDGRLLVCRKIDASIPDLRQFVAKFSSAETKIRLPRAAVLDALKRLQGFADADAFPHVTGTIGEEFTLQSGNEAVGVGTERVEAEILSGNGTFRVRHPNFTEAVRHVRSDHFLLFYAHGANGRPIVVQNDDPNGTLGEWAFMSATIYDGAQKEGK